MNSKRTRPQWFFVILVKWYSREQVLDKIDDFIGQALELMELQQAQSQDIVYEINNDLSGEFQIGNVGAIVCLDYHHELTEHPQFNASRITGNVTDGLTTEKKILKFQATVSSLKPVKGFLFVSTVLIS